jgi:hypothetical protein
MFIQEWRGANLHPRGSPRWSRDLGNNAKGLQQTRCQDGGTASSKPRKGSYVDFTVVSGYFECLLFLAVLIVLGVVEGVLESL